jgi:succinate dehydrogenase hydrophobic anchor subunit
MDYIKPAAIRFALQIGVILSLVVYMGWSVLILLG